LRAADRPPEIPRPELEIRFVRSSGSGGQNVNKVNTKAVLRWNLRDSTMLPDDVRERFLARFGRRVSSSGELVLTSDRYRDQRRNVEDCLEKLRAMLASVWRPPRRRKPTRPSRAAKEQRLAAKRARGETKRRRGAISGGDND
jgi:ribosome-associated protein